ncbi:MAG: type I restriction endonuclease [bacterium]|nr:type I restriction endonuclease [bacterium]
MDFKDAILQLADRISKLKDNIATEEATKNAFIMPMISALGYDVFNPLEVVPELDCDLVKKKGEKIDYAIIKDGVPILLIECKHIDQDLTLHDTQLQKYFVASNARFGVLTNGIEYRFYTDLDKQNIMDERPFLVVNMLEISEAEIEQLKKFHKSYYDVEEILSTAQELKYMTDVKGILNKEFANPSKEFVKYIIRPIYSGQIKENVLDLFTPIVKKSIASIIKERIAEKLNFAIKTNDEPAPAAQEPEQPKEEELPEGVVAINKETGVTTTQEEIDAFLIVKAILRQVVDIHRVYYRDTLSYFGILLDDNNRKPICRMYFNAKSAKYIATIDENKKETKHEIKSLDDIYEYADAIKAAVGFYEK